MLKKINDLKERELREMWKKEKQIEDNVKCPKCNDYTLVGTNPFKIELLCSKCGNLYNIK